MKIKLFTVADGKLSYSESGESTSNLLRNMVTDEDLKGDNLYEDQKRSQPRDKSAFDEGNPAIKPDLVVKVRRSDSKPFFDKYKGSKGKSEIVSPAYDKGYPNKEMLKIPRSKVLL
jgi:hypothetical protein